MPNTFDNSSLYRVIKVETISGHPLQTTTAGTVANDAFGRLRSSTPLTLFDSSHRYQDNGMWSTATGTGGTYAFSANEGLVNLNVNTVSGASVIRESNTVCSYQPGKSLLFLSTFVLNEKKENLRQRVGYFGPDNGIYLELDGDSVPAFVERSSVTGSVVETKVPQTGWNVDTLDGLGASGLTLDPTKAQILWFDIEWLGLGTVRAGFVIDGQLIHCHSFHHANLVTSTYITTASLPLRYEIENLGTTASASTLKQICSSVVSEGGYELRGRQRAVGTPIDTPVDLTSTGVDYPIVSLRLKSSPDRLDAVVIPTAVSVLGQGPNGVFEWQLRQGGTTVSGTWVDAGADSAVEYNLSGTSISGGTTLAKGYVTASNQSSVSVDILKEALFKFQLERNGLTGTPIEFTLVARTKVAGDDFYGALDWEEVSL
jgi:hypothetical protein